MRNYNCLIPDGLSKRWIKRFEILEFNIDHDGFLYSPKVFNNEWDNQTKALFWRTIGFSAPRIAKILDVPVITVKKRWLVTIRDYRVRPICQYDWASIGATNKKGKQFIRFGGSPDITMKQVVSSYQHQMGKQLEMDMELNVIRNKLRKDIVRTADRPK